MPKFVDWLAAELGTRKWFVGRWSAFTRSKYEVAVSPQRFRKLADKYARLAEEN